MTCTACTAANSDPRSGLYQLGCHDCAARSLAHSPTYFTADAMHTITPPYRAALALVQRSGESLEDAHRRVRAWDKRIREAIGSAGSATAGEAA